MRSETTVSSYRDTLAEALDPPTTKAVYHRALSKALGKNLPPEKAEVLAQREAARWKQPLPSPGSMAPQQRALFERLLQDGKGPSEAEAQVEKELPSATLRTENVFHMLYESGKPQARSLSRRGMGRLAPRIFLDERWRRVRSGEWAYRGWALPRTPDLAERLQAARATEAASTDARLKERDASIARLLEAHGPKSDLGSALRAYRTPEAARARLASENVPIRTQQRLRRLLRVYASLEAGPPSLATETPVQPVG